jgi:hypothetical protein
MTHQIAARHPERQAALRPLGSAELVRPYGAEGEPTRRCSYSEATGHGG